MVSLALAALIASHSTPPIHPSSCIPPPSPGAQVGKDARVTVHFTATAPDGTILADTKKRGMAFTFLMDQDTVEPFLHDAVRGLSEGGTRTVRVRASRAGMTREADPVLTITVGVVRVAPL